MVVAIFGESNGGRGHRVSHFVAVGVVVLDGLVARQHLRPVDVTHGKGLNEAVEGERERQAAMRRHEHLVRRDAHIGPIEHVDLELLTDGGRQTVGRLALEVVVLAAHHVRHHYLIRIRREN